MNEIDDLRLSIKAWQDKWDHAESEWAREKVKREAAEAELTRLRQADQRGIALWRKKTGQPEAYRPDHAHLVEWLLSEVTRLEGDGP